MNLVVLTSSTISLAVFNMSLAVCSVETGWESSSDSLSTAVWLLYDWRGAIMTIFRDSSAVEFISDYRTSYFWRVGGKNENLEEMSEWPRGGRRVDQSYVRYSTVVRVRSPARLHQIFKSHLSFDNEEQTGSSNDIFHNEDGSVGA